MWNAVTIDHVSTDVCHDCGRVIDLANGEGTRQDTFLGSILVCDDCAEWTSEDDDSVLYDDQG